MSFDFYPLDRFKLVRQKDENGDRYYVDPEGNRYRSVTTQIGKFADKTALEEWKKRIGEEEAAKQSARASSRGTNIHKMMEEYLLGEIDFSKPIYASPINLETFKKLQPILDNYVSKIYGIEHPLFSKRYKAAGTADLILDWKGKATVFDLKTAKKRKRFEWIEDYRLQSAMYSEMVEEMYNGVSIEQFVICILVDNEPKPQVFIESDIKQYRQRLSEIFS